MIIIGEKINATRKRIAAALEQRDEGTIVAAAAGQAEAGADYLDVNGGDPRAGREAENMRWLVELVQSNTTLPVSVDTADPEAARVGLSMASGKPILNSVSLERERLASMLPLVGEFDCMVVALLMSDDGTPCGVDDRVERAARIIGKLQDAGKALRDIIVDVCFLPVCTDAQAGRAVIDAIAAVKQRWPDVHVGGGCSNVSFGLPQRKFVNQAAIVQAVYHGMDVCIADPTVPGTTELILAAEAAAGADEFCMNYVTKMR